jgi:hypothetical protein
MTLYLISFDASAMDHIPDEDMPAVGKAAHAVVQEAVNAGVWVFGGGLENQRASIVATDGNVADGPYPCSARRIADGDVPTTSDRWPYWSLTRLYVPTGCVRPYFGRDSSGPRRSGCRRSSGPGRSGRSRGAPGGGRAC